MASRSDERRPVVAIMQQFGRIWIANRGADRLSKVFVEDVVFKRRPGPVLNGIAEVQEYWWRENSSHPTTDLVYVPLPESYRKLSGGLWNVKFRFSPRKRDDRFLPCEWSAVVGVKEGDGRIEYFDEMWPTPSANDAFGIGAWRALGAQEPGKETADKRGRKIARRREKWCNGKTKQAFEDALHWG